MLSVIVLTRTLCNTQNDSLKCSPIAASIELSPFSLFRSLRVLMYMNYVALTLAGSAKLYAWFHIGCLLAASWWALWLWVMSAFSCIAGQISSFKILWTRREVGWVASSLEGHSWAALCDLVNVPVSRCHRHLSVIGRFTVEPLPNLICIISHNTECVARRHFPKWCCEW